LDDVVTTANVRAASQYPVFGAEIAERLEHQMHKQRFAMDQPSTFACGNKCRLFR
jgi:hypothetical protein